MWTHTGGCAAVGSTPRERTRPPAIFHTDRHTIFVNDFFPISGTGTYSGLRLDETVYSGDQLERTNCISALLRSAPARTSFVVAATPSPSKIIEAVACVSS